MSRLAKSSAAFMMCRLLLYGLRWIEWCWEEMVVEAGRLCLCCWRSTGTPELLLFVDVWSSYLAGLRS